MQMTDSFAAAVTVSIPIFALAAGAEARTIRDRLKRPDESWEHDFARYSAEHELDLTAKPSEVIGYFKGAPVLSKLYFVERVMAIAAAAIWLAVFILLTIAELRCLLWLADGEPAGNSGLATFTIVAVGLAMTALIVAPAAYLLVPLMMPFDLVPKGLKDTVAPRVASKQGWGFVKQVFSELEGAIDRTADKVVEQEHKRRKDVDEAQPGDPGAAT